MSEYIWFFFYFYFFFFFFKQKTAYEIEVSLSGFQTAVRSGIVLAVGDQTVVNFTLQVGQVAEKVEVTAQAPLVDTMATTIYRAFGHGTSAKYRTAMKRAQSQ